MQVTHAQANKIVKQYDEEISHLYAIERKRKSFTEIVGIEPVIPEYDFLATHKRIDELFKKKAEVKHAMNLFNATHVLEEIGITVDQALIRMAQLSSLKSTYDAMRSEPSKTVNSDTYGTKTEYTCLNYDPEDAARLYTETCAELTKVQLALDLCNNTVTFDIP